MIVDDLLADLEPLTHDARLREMVGQGRVSRDGAALVAALSDLERRGFYERYLALVSCFGSRDGAHVLRSLTDPSRTICGLAITLVPLVCDDTQALRAFDLLHPSSRRRLARRLRRKRRLGPIDAFVRGLAEKGDSMLADLLPYGSAEAVAAHIERVRDSAGIHFWTRLARQHPTIAAEMLSRRAETMVDEDPRLLWQANAALPVLAEVRPDAALRLLQVLSVHMSLHRLALDPVLKSRPAAIVDLVLRSDDPVRLALDRSTRAHARGA